MDCNEHIGNISGKNVFHIGSFYLKTIFMYEIIGSMFVVQYHFILYFILYFFCFFVLGLEKNLFSFRIFSRTFTAPWRLNNVIKSFKFKTCFW